MQERKRLKGHLNMKKTTDRALVIVYMILLFVITYLIVMKSCLNCCSDYSIHSCLAYSLLLRNPIEYFKENAYPLWHFLVYILIKQGVLKNDASAIITGFLNVVTLSIVYKYCSKKCITSKIGIATVAFLTVIIGPMYLPFYNEYVYVGQGSPNVWHNPTNLCVRPIAIVTFWLFCDLFKKQREKQAIRKSESVLLSLLIILGQMAKPSLIQILIPGIVLYLVLVYRECKDTFFDFAKLIMGILFPGICLLVFQYVISFYVSSMADGGVVIAPFAFLKEFSPNIFISFVLGYAFPLYVYITNSGLLKNIETRFALCLAVSGLLESVFFAESGSRMNHGNLFWGYLLGMFIVYMVSILQFFSINIDRKNKAETMKYVGGCLLLCLQIIAGVYYIFILLETPAWY